MGILNIRPAVRGGSKVILGIGGISGSGKTYTALKIARGMVKTPSKIGFLDTENLRGSLYADILDGQFMIGDLYPPFSPKRYADAIKEFQDAGVEVLVIDSISHEWEGDGGCDDIAKSSGGKIDNWRLGKSEHKKFMNALLQCNMHVICCIRAREKTDFKNPSQPVSLGIQPVCEKNFMFEMTASILMSDEGLKQKSLKVPSFLKATFGKGDGYLGEETGKKILEWVDKGAKEDPEVTKCKSEMLMVCESGVKALTQTWEALTPEMKAKMLPHMGVYKASAKAYDEQNKATQSESVATLDDLQQLFDVKSLSLAIDVKEDIQRIITNKEEQSYQKAFDILKTL